MMFVQVDIVDVAMFYCDCREEMIQSAGEGNH